MQSTNVRVTDLIKILENVVPNKIYKVYTHTKNTHIIGLDF